MMVSPAMRATLRILAQLAKEDNLNAAEIRRRDPMILRATLYTTLYRLETKGLVESSQEIMQNHPGQPYRFYSLTEKGRKLYPHLVAIEEMMAE